MISSRHHLAIRRRQRLVRFAESLTDTWNYGMQKVLGRSSMFGLQPILNIRFGHFDYLKEDSDDEYKREDPTEIVDSSKFVKTVSLADKLAAEAELNKQRQQETYEKNNDPYNKEIEGKKWASWMTIQEGREKYKFDRDYSSKKFFERMNFSGGGTIQDDPIQELDDDKESTSILSDLGKGVTPGIRLVGEKAERTQPRRQLSPPQNERVQADVGFGRLPNLNLGRQYDTGLRFDRTRPTVRKDRYANSWYRPEIIPKVQQDGRMDTRPVFEFDLAKTTMTQYRGGDKIRSEPNGALDAFSEPTELETMVDSEIMSESHSSGGRPLGAYSKTASDRPTFRYMTTWNEVYDAFKNLQGDHIATEISQAFFVLKNMKPPPREVLVEMADIAVQHAHKMTPTGLTNVIHACAKLKFIHPSLLQEWKNQLNDPRVMEACTDLDITTLIYSFGVIQRTATATRFIQDHNPKWNGLNSEFIEMLASESIHPVRMQNYGYSMMVNIFYGLALMKCSKHDAFVKILSVLTRDDVLRQLEIANINAVIYAIGYMRYWNPELTTKLLKQSLSCVSEFPTSGIANIMWSLGNLRYPNLEIVGPLARAAVDEKHLKSYAEQDLTSVLYGIAMCKYKDPLVIGPLMTEVMRPGRLQRMQDSSLCHMISSFASLRYSNNHLFGAILTELCSSKRLKSLKNMHVANIFYALGSCRYEHSVMLETLMDEAMDPDRLQSFIDFDIATIVQGIGGMKIQDKEFVTAIMNESGKEERMSGYSAHSLANILSACSSIQYRDEALLTRFCQELSKPERIRQLSPAGVGVATLALCRLQFYDGKYFSEYLKESTRSRKINVTRPTTLIDLMFGAVRADVVHFAQFMEIIKLLRDPKKLDMMLNFPFIRLLSITAILGLRDESFLESMKQEVLKTERLKSFTPVELREAARAFERLGIFDEELCAALNYGRRFQGQSTGILAPGGLRQTEEAGKQKELDQRVEESNVDWTGLPRSTFYNN